MLTARKRAFVDYYKTCWNGAESVRRLGYKGKNANRLASQLLSDPDVKEEIRKELESLDAMADKYSFAKVALREFDNAPNTESVKPRYLEIAGKAMGYLGSNDNSNNINVFVGENTLASIRSSLKTRGKEIESSSITHARKQAELTPPLTNPSLDNNTLDTRSTESPAS